MRDVTRLSALALAASTMLGSLNAAAQEMPPRQIGDLNVNAVTMTPLWTIHQTRYPGTVDEALAELSTIASAQKSAQTATPSIVTWQSAEPASAILDHLIVTEVKPDEEEGAGAIITAHIFADGPEAKSVNQFADTTGEEIATAFGGDVRAKSSGAESVSIGATRIVDASFETVWRIIVDEFGEVAKWSSVISENTFFAGEHDGLLGAARTCFIPSFGSEVEEKVVVSDKGAGHFAYEVLAGMPPFAQGGRADWRMVDLGNGTTDVSAVISFDVANGTPGLPVGMAKQNFAQVLEISIDELVYYAENGTPHPREIASR
ncbi:MAG: SRPBCC family protein [Pseudomonadota bacterium]